MHIAQNCFIVTGAASGLGAAVAQMLLAQGAQVIAVDLNPPATPHPQQKFVRTDVTDAAQAQAAVEAAVALAKETGTALRGLINCAGIAPGERVLGRKGVHALDSFARAININLIGTFNMLRLAAEAMAEGAPDADGARGVIINTASIAAYDGQIGQAAYAASKGGVVALTLPIARELAGVGIRVMTIAPGIFETPMMAGLPQEVQDSLGDKVPFPSRLGKPAEYAALARHIIENTMLNGEVIRLDGALRMAPK